MPKSNKKNKTGRPEKINKTVIRRIAKSVRLGIPFTLACRSGGITYETFNEWRKRGEAEKAEGKSSLYSEFSEAVSKAQVDALDSWMQDLQRAAEGGAWQASAWKAERRYPDIFSRPAPQGGVVNINLIIGQIINYLAQIIPDPDMRLQLADQLERQGQEANEQSV